jgi:hypothetical protein
LGLGKKSGDKTDSFLDYFLKTLVCHFIQIIEKKADNTLHLYQNFSKLSTLPGLFKNKGQSNPPLLSRMERIWLGKLHLFSANAHPQDPIIEVFLCDFSLVLQKKRCIGNFYE